MILKNYANYCLQYSSSQDYSLQNNNYNNNYNDNPIQIKPPPVIKQKTKIEQLKDWIGGSPTLVLAYKGTRDGFTAQKFHALCDNVGPTLTLISTDRGKLFGGYTSLSWTSPQFTQWKSDKYAFIFSLTHRTMHKQHQILQLKNFKILISQKWDYLCFKSNCVQSYHQQYLSISHFHLQGTKKKKVQFQNYQQSVDHCKDYLVAFGGGHDFRISDNCNLNSESYCNFLLINIKCNFGFTYELPEGMIYDSEDARTYLAGAYQFRVIEIEVYQVNKV